MDTPLHIYKCAVCDTKNLVDRDGRIVCLHCHPDGPKPEPSADEKLNAALGVLRGDYYDDVGNTAEGIKSELYARLKDGECGETLREWLMEHIRETIDSAQRIIYTAQAIQCLLFSSNDGRYFEEFGAEGAVTDGSINWSAIAFSAFEADVIERLERLSVDVNNPVPECPKCGADDQDERKLVNDELVCAECAKPEAEEVEED